MKQLFATTFPTKMGHMRAISDERGLLRLDWEQTPFPISDQENGVSRETSRQVQAYLSGELRDFTLPLSPDAVTAKLQHWLAHIAAIPYGEVHSYRDLARAWGNEKAARAAGSACQRNPLPIIIPCHRVIGTDATFTRYSGGDRTRPDSPANIARKKALLDLEAGLKQTS